MQKSKRIVATENNGEDEQNQSWWTSGQTNEEKEKRCKKTKIQNEKGKVEKLYTVNKNKTRS